MLVILALCLLQLFHVDACETTKDGVSWTFDASVDQVVTGVETVQECKNECLKKETCTAYTLVEGPLNYCFLFPNPSQPIKCSGCKSGFITRIVSGSGCKLNPENIIEEAVTDSVEECLDLCADTDKCTNFLYFNSSSVFSNVCFLYNGCDGIGDCEDCQSGQINCFTELPEECTNYKVLDDSTRNNQHGYEDYCDDTDYHTSPDWQGKGVYRMVSPAGTQIPERNPGFAHCGTGATGWTRDEHPQTPGDQKSMTVCFTNDDDECYYHTEISATNCGEFYVYLLDNAPWCHLRYCGSF